MPAHARRIADSGTARAGGGSGATRRAAPVPRARARADDAVVVVRAGVAAARSPARAAAPGQAPGRTPWGSGDVDAVRRSRPCIRWVSGAHGLVAHRQVFDASDLVADHQL